ncbi:hypothetical protein D3C80_1998270 [compost metagenome]
MGNSIPSTSCTRREYPMEKPRFRYAAASCVSNSGIGRLPVRRNSTSRSSLQACSTLITAGASSRVAKGLQSLISKGSIR